MRVWIRLVMRAFGFFAGCVATSLMPALASETGRYRVVVDVTMDAAAPPRDLPQKTHWSRLVAVAHSERFSLFADGNTATSGLALLATNGRTSVLEAELAEGARRGRVGESIVVGGLGSGTGRFDLELTVTEDAPVVSFATMLAPSPDWFAGGSAVLRENGVFRDVVTVPLWIWDAGADSGPTFNARNEETQPRQSVRLLTHPAFLRADGLLPVGKATLTRLE